MRFFRWSAGAACAAAAIFALTFLAPHHSQAQFASPVRVMNGVSDAVPTVAQQSGPVVYGDHRHAHGERIQRREYPVHGSGRG
jgi:hypothetical protein